MTGQRCGQSSGSNTRGDNFVVAQTQKDRLAKPSVAVSIPGRRSAPRAAVRRRRSYAFRAVDPPGKASVYQRSKLLEERGQDRLKILFPLCRRSTVPVTISTE